METVAYSPAHLTGILQICDQHSGLLQIGSKGAGICIDLGVYTKVKGELSSKPRNLVLINGVACYSPVSEYVLQRYQSIINRSYSLTVKHEARVPIGAGFGTSGAGALSLSLALNDNLNLGLSKIETSQIAHEAEIKCKTGLGTVIAETYGGVEIRIKEGAPGIGRVWQIEPNGHRAIVALYYGPVSTERMLSDPHLHQQIERIAPRMTDDLIRHPSIKKFLWYSRMFSEALGLMSGRMKRVVRGLQEYGFDCGMAMFGEVVFTLTQPQEVGEVQRLFRKFSPNGRILTANVDPKGARIV